MPAKGVIVTQSKIPGNVVYLGSTASQKTAWVGSVGTSWCGRTNKTRQPDPCMGNIKTVTSLYKFLYIIKRIVCIPQISSRYYSECIRLPQLSLHSGELRMFIARKTLAVWLQSSMGRVILESKNL